MPSHGTRWWTSYSCEAKFQCLYWPKAVSGCFDVMLFWKLKVLTKRVSAPWHEGERLQSDLVASWQQTSQIVFSVSKSLPKAWYAAGYEERGWQFDGSIVMPLKADDSCLPELEKVVWLKVTRWCRKGALSKTALRDSMCCHTFSTELVLADGLPSLSNGVVQSSLQCIFLPTFLLENLNIYFFSLNAASLQAAPTYPLFQVFAVLWRKKERLRHWRMFWFNSNRGSA